jgi:RimJ/RimL family protein N-acetyltransferase
MASQHTVFDTERLVIRTATERDVSLLYELWTDPRVMAHVGFPHGLLSHLFAHTRCTAVQATPNVHNVASIKMQEAVGGVRVGEQVYEFPEAMRDYTTPVHHYIYHVYRTNWEQDQPDRAG